MLPAILSKLENSGLEYRLCPPKPHTECHQLFESMILGCKSCGSNFTLVCAQLHLCVYVFAYAAAGGWWEKVCLEFASARTQRF